MQKKTRRYPFGFYRARHPDSREDREEKPAAKSKGRPRYNRRDRRHSGYMADEESDH